MRRLAILLGAAAALWPRTLSADDQVDVRGGFFKKSDIERSFFDPAPKSPPAGADAPPNLDRYNESASKEAKPSPRSNSFDHRNQPAQSGPSDSFSFGKPFSDRSSSSSSSSAQSPVQAAAQQAAAEAAAAADEDTKLTPDQLSARTSSLIEQVKQMQNSPERKRDLEAQTEFLKRAVSAKSAASTPSAALNRGATGIQSENAFLRYLELKNDDRTTLSVVVSANPKNHLASVLNQLSAARERKRVTIERVILIGTPEPKQYKEPTVPFYETPVLAPKTDGSVRYPSTFDGLLEMIKRSSLRDMQQFDAISYNPSMASKWSALSASEQAAYARKVEQAPGQEEALASSESLYSGPTQSLMRIYNSMSKADYAKLNKVVAAKVPQWSSEVRGADPENKALLDLNLVAGPAIHAQEFVSRGNLKNSPVWIVKTKKELHVFEGDYSPEQFFDDYGNFHAP